MATYQVRELEAQLAASKGQAARLATQLEGHAKREALIVTCKLLVIYSGVYYQLTANLLVMY